ncbi:MAG TPA: acetylxylan esterase [Thermomicrobiales bacterium]|nr:acetylxylan esterase [Thermomicrobiales bacterium]
MTDSTTTGTTPETVATWWDAIDTELAAMPAAPERFAIPLYSTGFATTYQVRLTSIGRYRIAAYVSIPHGEGPFPALLAVPGYGSVVTPPQYEDRQRYVVMTLMYRGTRHADWPYAGKFPGVLTDGIADSRTWVYRGILADHLRGLEFLAGMPEVDPSRIGLIGNDIALLIAARRPSVTAVAVTASFFHQAWEVAQGSEAYPIEEINDYVRTCPADRDGVRTSLALVDPGTHAAAISARVLLSVNEPGSGGDSAWWASLTANLGGQLEEYPVTHAGQADRDAVDAWLATALGSEPKPRIWTPEELGPWS